MFYEIMSTNTRNVFDRLKKLSGISDFYLSGGTGLALHLGHRESGDLDFFTETSFSPFALQKTLEEIGILRNTIIEKNTLNTTLDQVKLQFLHYPYPLINPPFVVDFLKISSLEDIACTKIMTISMRGSKKDFIDLFFLLQQLSLEDLFKLVGKKYSSVEYNLQHLLKSLVYYADADEQPMPRMHKEAKWSQIKKEILLKVKAYK